MSGEWSRATYHAGRQRDLKRLGERLAPVLRDAGLDGSDAEMEDIADAIRDIMTKFVQEQR